MVGLRRMLMMCISVALALGGSITMTGPAVASDCTQTSVGFTALSDLRDGTYHGQEGGLYPGGKDGLPKAYRHIGTHRAGKVQPLSRSGAPGAGGSIVLLSVGMSNTHQEFGAFMQEAETDSRVNPRVVLVNGAQGGWDASDIANPGAAYWTNIDKQLDAAGVGAKQVQVVWFKEAERGEDRPFPEDAQGLQASLRTTIGIMRDRYPNLRIVYLASRIYAGYATTAQNPEPFAYESGFAVKWLIADDIATPAKERPWLAWGPYLWADGTDARSDGLVWVCQDFESDGTHPSESGEQKVADMLMSFLTKKSTATPWFTAA